MRQVHWKPLILITGATLLAGGLSALLTGSSMAKYQMLAKPALSPPGMVFPVVWTILYLLMGISAWMIYETRTRGKTRALKLYLIQLAVNLMWPLLFFGMQWYLFSFFWLLLLLLLVILMILRFLPISRTAALLQIPYAFWLIFAGYLNISVWLMNG